MSYSVQSLISCGYVDSNSYIITDDNTGFAAVIDPDFQNISLDGIVKENNIKLILLTHAHFDHIVSCEELREKTKAPIYVHELDKAACEERNINLSTAFGFSVSFSADGTFTDGDVIALGESKIKVLHTPGHTKGSSCFIIGSDMFSGDMLFSYSIGRTDFPGGSVKEMRESIKKLKEIDTDYTVYPGHGGSTGLFFEKDNNPYFYGI